MIKINKIKRIQKKPKETEKQKVQSSQTAKKLATKDTDDNNCFKFITTQKGLTECCKELSKVKSFAIDIECENGLHHYGTYVCLIQISTPKEHFVIDSMKFPTRQSLLPLLKILEDEKIEKILHDYSFDLRIIYTQYKSRPKNVFDTQMACLLIGKEKLGLASLLEAYCKITAEKKFQRYDWTRRPLSEKMLAYAIGDTNNLIFIKKKLVAELKEKKRLTWCEQECQEIAGKNLKYHEQSFYDLKGIRSLDNKQRAILLKLWQLRDNLAKKHDKPLHYVLGTKQMMEIAKKPPRTERAWKYMPKSNRYIKSNTKLFSDAVQSAKGVEIMVPPKPRKKMTAQQKRDYEALETKRNKIAEKLGIRGHLIACNDQMLEIVVTGKRDCLREWQRKLLV